MIDIKRVKRTRGGHEVRIYATDGGGSYPIHGACFCEEGWRHRTWAEDGKFVKFETSEYDLVEEPETVEIDVWLNVREDGSSIRWESREQADRNALNRIACIHIKRTVQKGEGL